jgi:hypothetical protein
VGDRVTGLQSEGEGWGCRVAGLGSGLGLQSYRVTGLQDVRIRIRIRVRVRVRVRIRVGVRVRVRARVRVRFGGGAGAVLTP